MHCTRVTRLGYSLWRLHPAQGLSVCVTACEVMTSLMEERRSIAHSSEKLQYNFCSMSVKVTYKGGVFEPLEKVDGASAGKIYW